MFTGNIYYRGDKTAAEEMLHEATQLANSAVAKKEYLGVDNFREQFVLSTGATLDIFLGQHTTFMTIVGFGAEYEEVEEIEEEEEEEKIALFVCQPKLKDASDRPYPQVVVYATEYSNGDDTKISMEWGDGIKGGWTYSQFRGKYDQELISLEHTDRSQYIEGTNYSEGAGTKAYVGGYTLVDADLPLLGAAKVKTEDPNTSEVYEALCFVAYDDPNDAIKLYYHPLYADIDYESADFETPLIDWVDCTLFETIPFKEYDWKDPSNLRANNDFTLATFDSDGTTCVFSALNGRWRYDAGYPFDSGYPTEEENRQDLWTLTLEASKDPGDGHIVLEVVTEEYELVTVTCEWQEDSLIEPTTIAAPPSTSTPLEAPTCSASIGVSYNSTTSGPYIKNSSYVNSRNGVAGKGPYIGRVIDSAGDTHTAEYLKENINLFNEYYGGFLGSYVEAQGVNTAGGYFQNTSTGSAMIAHLSQNDYGGRRQYYQSISYDGLSDYAHPLYTSGVPLKIPPGEDWDYLKGGKNYTVTFPHFTDTTKERRVVVDYTASGFFVGHGCGSAYYSSWDTSGPGAPGANPCIHSLAVAGTTPYSTPDAAVAGTAERKETKYTPLNFALREGISISARYTRPSKAAEYIIYSFDDYWPWPDCAERDENGLYTNYRIGIGFEEYGYGATADPVKDYSVRGSCSYTLESKYDNKAVVLDLPDINQYHDNLPDTNQNVTPDSRYWYMGAAAGGFTYYGDSSMSGQSYSMFTHVWHESIEDCQWPNQIRDGIQDYRSYTPDPPHVAFCSHPRNYLMFSCGNKFAQSFFENEAGNIVMTWSLYDQKSEKFTDLVEMYNKLLEPLYPTSGLPYSISPFESFYRYSTPQPPWGNRYYHVQPDLMLKYGMVSKIPLPQLRTP